MESSLPWAYESAAHLYVFHCMAKIEETGILDIKEREPWRYMFNHALDILNEGLKDPNYNSIPGLAEYTESLIYGLLADGYKCISRLNSSIDINPAHVERVPREDRAAILSCFVGQ